ncbi:MAG: efflux RND transporter periplasmic adaptor subunit [Verrucomicrobiota bacterium]
MAKTPNRIVAITTRALLPLLLLGAGWFGASKLSFEPEEEAASPPAAKPVKTRVTAMIIEDVPTTVTTQGTVRPHDEISLSAQVAGKVVKIDEQFQDGAFFEEGDVLVELDEEDFKTAVIVAEAEVARMNTELADEQARGDRARQDWRELGLEGEPNELVLRVPQLKEAKANLKAAEAQLERANRDLDRAKVKAPFAGRVRTREVGLGETIGTATPLGTIFAIDYVEVRLPLSPRQQPMLRLPENAGDPTLEVEFSDALDSENPTIWTGEIVRTEGVLDPDSLEVFAIARINDPFNRKNDDGRSPLRIGQPVEAQITGNRLDNVIALPRSAVRQLDKIYLVDKEDLTLRAHTIDQIWANEDVVFVQDETIAVDRQLLALTHLVNTPDGSKVEIISSVDAEANTAAANESDSEDDS